MGTDICMRAEVRKNGNWEKVGNIFKNDWYDETRPLTDYNKPYHDRPYRDRCYDLFAILADVRNGCGFAGCKTGEGFNPIDEPRGYPDDMAFEEDDFYGGHSASWFTLRELKEYDWEQTTCHIGVIKEEQYIEFKRTGEHPNSWSGGVHGQSIVTVNEETMDAILNYQINRDYEKKYYVQCKFNPMTYRECCQYFIDTTIPALESLISEDVTEDDVRIIFDFDC